MSVHFKTLMGKPIEQTNLTEEDQQVWENLVNHFAYQEITVNQAGEIPKTLHEAINVLYDGTEENPLTQHNNRQELWSKTIPLTLMKHYYLLS